MDSTICEHCQEAVYWGMSTTGYIEKDDAFFEHFLECERLSQVFCTLINVIDARIKRELGEAISNHIGWYHYNGA